MNYNVNVVQLENTRNLYFVNRNGKNKWRKELAKGKNFLDNRIQTRQPMTCLNASIKSIIFMLCFI